MKAAGDLTFEGVRESSRLYNSDLAPVPPERLTVCIPTYQLASGLISQGMNWWQAVITILLGNLIVLIPMTLNAHPGTAYGIPFPVQEGLTNPQSKPEEERNFGSSMW